MKICIDAGHNNSGHDVGASGNGLREQDVTFFIAHKLADRLRKHGIEVVETRLTKETNLGYDVNSSLQERCNIANRSNSDYFISIHCNAGVSNANGTETWVYGLGGKAEQLAKSVQANLVSSIGTRNRGIKVGNLKVLRSTNMPAILIEVAFISNASDARILANRQDDIVDGIAKGICDYLGIKYKGGDTLQEYTDIGQIVWDLSYRGIITDSNKWIQKANEDQDVYWLMRKALHYMRLRDLQIK